MPGAAGQESRTGGNVGLMSLIRALSKDLAARSDDSLRALFAARPDLVSPPVPDFSALAARASARISVQRALERLNRPQMQVLETLHLCTNPDTEHSASAAGLRKLIAGSSVAAVERILGSLQELALVHRAEVRIQHIVKDLPPIYEAFYGNEAARKCPQCGTIHPGKKPPEGWVKL